MKGLLIILAIFLLLYGKGKSDIPKSYQFQKENYKYVRHMRLFRRQVILMTVDGRSLKRSKRFFYISTINKMFKKLGSLDEVQKKIEKSLKMKVRNFKSYDHGGMVFTQAEQQCFMKLAKIDQDHLSIQFCNRDIINNLNDNAQTHENIFLKIDKLASVKLNQKVRRYEKWIN
jgi:hypothetical protein